LLLLGRRRWRFAVAGASLAFCCGWAGGLRRIACIVGALLLLGRRRWRFAVAGASPAFRCCRRVVGVLLWLGWRAAADRPHRWRFAVAGASSLAFCCRRRVAWVLLSPARRLRSAVAGLAGCGASLASLALCCCWGVVVGVLLSLPRAGSVAGR